MILELIYVILYNVLYIVYSMYSFYFELGYVNSHRYITILQCNILVLNLTTKLLRLYLFWIRYVTCCYLLVLLSECVL